MTKRKPPTTIVVYRVVTICDDAVVETFEAADDNAARTYASGEHADYGYLLQAYAKDYWREVEFKP